MEHFQEDVFFMTLQSLLENHLIKVDEFIPTHDA
jgi:hypothetical protein